MALATSGASTYSRQRLLRFPGYAYPSVEAGEGRVQVARLSLPGSMIKWPSLRGACLNSCFDLTWISVGRAILFFSIGVCSLPPRVEARLAAEPALSLPARLDGGRKGVPSHLPGTIYVSTDRVEFHAFPQVEDLVWSCRQIGDLRQHYRPGSAIVTIEVAGSVYRFNLMSPR